MTTIALAGKGGSGKTTISSFVIDYLLRRGKRPILAVDADPNSNLNEALGVSFDGTVASVVDEIMEKKEELPAGMTKDRLLEFHLQDALSESEGFDLLVMGRTEGPGCYCRANDLLRDFMEKLSENYQYVVMDNEAGMEHLSRKTTRDVDALLIVANPTPVSLRSAERINETAKKLKLRIKKAYLVINELGMNLPAGSTEVNLPLLGKIPYDEELLKTSLNSGCVFDSPENSIARKAVFEIMEKLSCFSNGI
ncbi:AAA family ATPase [candidate division NPL-UPA2 bacterium]|nr:AAA family ATPase [candidate division NPL-UPA2 bacterium]